MLLSFYHFIFLNSKMLHILVLWVINRTIQTICYCAVISCKALLDTRRQGKSFLDRKEILPTWQPEKNIKLVKIYKHCLEADTSRTQMIHTLTWVISTTPPLRLIYYPYHHDLILLLILVWVHLQLQPHSRCLSVMSPPEVPLKTIHGSMNRQ